MRSHRLFSKSILAMAISQVIFAGAAIAEESTVLDELKIEGRAITELDQEITSEDIENTQATDLEDLFRNKSEVTAGGAIKLGQKVYVRNIGEDALNITIDGAEQPVAVFHHAGRITIAPELLKRVEVEAGPADATSGPGALGGSIRFVTKDASDLLDEDKNIGALLKSTYSSNGEGLKNSATVYGRTESGKVEGMLHLTYSNHNDMEDGSGNTIDGSEQDEGLGFAKVKLRLTDEQSLTISHESITDEGQVLYKPEWILYGTSNYLTDSSSDRETTTLNYTFTDADNDLIDTKVTVYNTKNIQERYYDSGSSEGTVHGYVETTGATVQNTSLINIHEITYGLNHRDDKSYMLDGTDNDTTYESTASVTGVYIQDSIEITDKLTLSAGARYDQYDVTHNDTNYSSGGLSPNIGVVYQINENIKINSHYAQAIRGYELIDSYALYRSYESEDLDVESSENIELGATYQKDQLEISFGVYQSIISDPIGIVAKNTYGNLEDDIETTGFYLDAKYQLNKVFLGLHFHSAESLANDNFVTRYEYGSTATNIGDTLALSIDYEMSKTFQAGWSAEFVKGIHNIDTHIDAWWGSDDINFDKPGYAVHNIYAKWLPLGDDKLTVSLAINNLLNKEYLSHASVDDWTDSAGWEEVSGQNSAGRDIRLSAAYKF
jgi:hemoglobin/transferrin/lactoferrin receptor protein